jgi:hypothetical protein
MDRGGPPMDFLDVAHRDFYLGIMSRASCDPQSQPLIDSARSLVLEWLREAQRDPRFLIDQSESELASCHGRIVDCFLNWINRSGFEANMVEMHRDGAAAFEVHWTHNGATFVGFKQAPPAGKPSDALLLGCAALLQNDWCRKQLER